MSDAPYLQGNFNPGNARDALKQLRQKGKGSLTVTSGLQDIRLSVESRAVTLEAEGSELYGEDERDLVRHFLCTVFWEDPTFFLDLNGEGAGTAASSISVNGSSYEILNQIDRGIVALKELHDRVPGLDLLVAVSGDPPPNGVKSPTANLFKVLARTPNGGHLASAANHADLDEIDAAWSVSDLMEASRATVRRPPATLTNRRLLHAEAYADQGLMPALRYTHVAKAISRFDPARAARLHMEAANAYLQVARAEQAMASYRACLDLSPESVAALEGLASALEESRRGADARRIREKLVKLFLAWNMPGRARTQLEKLSQPTAEERDLLLETMLLTGDHASATTLAQRMFPSLDSAEKTAMARRFAEHGARKQDLDRIVAMAGFHKLAPLRSFFKGVAAVAAIISLVLGGEVYLRLQHQSATAATKADMAEGRYQAARERWSMLSQADLSIGASSAHYPLTCLSSVGEIVRGIKKLENDQKMLLDSPQTHALLKKWQGLESDDFPKQDIRADYRALKAVEATSDQLLALQSELTGKIDAYRKEAEEKVETYLGLVKRTDEAKELLLRYDCVREFASYPDLFQSNVYLGIKVEVQPKGGQIRDELGPNRRSYKLARNDPSVLYDSWEIKYPLNAAADGLKLKITASRADYVEQSTVLSLIDIEETRVEFKLIHSVPHPERVRLETPAAQGRVTLLNKRAKSFDFNLRRKGVKAIEFAEAEPQAWSAGLTQLVGEDHQLIVRMVNTSDDFKRAYLTGIELWLVDQRSGKSATPRLLDQLGDVDTTRLQRTLTEVDEVEGRYRLESPETSRPARWNTILAALEHTVRDMVEEIQ